MRKLLLTVFALSVVSISAYAEDVPFSTSQTVDAASTGGVQTTPSIKKWYGGLALGVAGLKGWDMGPVDAYYNSIGYSVGANAANQSGMAEWTLYAGNRVRDFMDVELGYSHLTNLGGPNWARYSNAGNEVTSTRRVIVNMLYFSVSLREESGRGPYVKLGTHLSELDIQKKVTGTPANLDAIAAGDHMPGDGISTGVGTFFGFGFDIRTGKVGAVRLELNQFFRLGGTSYRKISWNAGYLLNF